MLVSVDMPLPHQTAFTKESQTVNHMYNCFVAFHTSVLAKSSAKIYFKILFLLKYLVEGEGLHQNHMLKYLIFQFFVLFTEHPQFSRAKIEVFQMNASTKQ